MPLPGLMAQPALGIPIDYALAAAGEGTSANNTVYSFQNAGAGLVGYTTTSDKLTVFVCAIENRFGTTRTIVDVSIGGDSFTEIAQASQGGGLDGSIGIFAIRGDYTNENITITCSGQAEGAIASFITLDNVLDDTASSTDTGSGLSASMSSTGGKPNDFTNGLWILGVTQDDSSSSTSISAGSGTEVADGGVSLALRLSVYAGQNNSDITVDFAGGANDYAFARAAWG